MPQFATSDGVKLYYERRGEGEPVLFVHGWTANRKFFADQIEALREDHEVIALDLRGHGDSDHPQAQVTLERIATDLRELLAYLDVGTVSMVGWSMGVHAIFEYVRQFGTDDIRDVTLIEMSPKLLTDDAWDLGLFGAFSHEDNMEQLTLFTQGWEAVGGDVFYELLNTLDEETSEWAISESLRTPTNVVVNLWIAMVSKDYRPDLAEIDVPALIVYGEESTLYAPAASEYMAEEIPEASVVGIPGVGHGVSLGRPKRLTEELRSFL